ncbi:unnamed protein product [Caretta caretta]
MWSQGRQGTCLNSTVPPTRSCLRCCHQCALSTGQDKTKAIPPQRSNNIRDRQRRQDAECRNLEQHYAVVSCEPWGRSVSWRDFVWGGQWLGSCSLAMESEDMNGVVKLSREQQKA